MIYLFYFIRLPRWKSDFIYIGYSLSFIIICLGVDGRTIFEWIFKEIDVSENYWIYSDDDSDYRGALVNTTLNLWVP